MRLRDFFPLTEHLISDDEARSIIAQIDPTVGQRIGHHGKSGALLFKAANRTVWKLLDDPFEWDTAQRLIGKRTDTIVPIIRLERIPTPNRIYYAMQTEELISLSRSESAALGHAIESYPPLEIANDADPQVADWLRRLFEETAQYGIEPDFGGEENVMKDRQGAWRLVDVG